MGRLSTRHRLGSVPTTGHRPRPPRKPCWSHRGGATQSDSLTPPLAMKPSVGAQMSAKVGAARGPKTTGP